MLLLHDGTKPQLRPYQQEVVSQVHRAIADGFKRPVIVAGTGSGKTVMAAQLIDDFVSQSKTILFVVHLDVLVGQTAEKLESFGVDHGFIKAGYPERAYASVQIASVQTLPRRNWWKRHHFDVVIFDEVHATGFSSIGKQLLTKYYPESIHIGLTATPYRLSKKEGLADYFNKLIQAPPPRELMEMGFLVWPKYFTLPEADLSGVGTVAGDYDESSLAVACNKPELIDRIFQEWVRLAPGKRTIAFGVNVNHAQAIANRFSSSGIPSAVVTGETSRNERKDIYKRFASGEILLISSVGVLTTGFDSPAAEVEIIARPTKSKALHYQMVGRVLRISPETGKTHGIVLDQAGNVRKFPFVEELKRFRLTNGEDSQGEAPKKVCESRDETCKTRQHGTVDENGVSLGCGALLYSFLQKCPHCGYKFPERVKAQLTGNLVELSVKRQQKAEKQPVTRSPNADRIDHLIRVAGNRQYQKGWVGHKVLETPNITKDDLKYTAKLLGYDWRWAEHKWEELQIQRGKTVATV